MPWHAGSGMLIKSAYVAEHGNLMTDYYIGVNMFVYFSTRQINNEDYKGPDLFVVKDVDGTRARYFWAAWEEEGRYPDVIIELLSPTTEANDFGSKRQIYERTFQTREYFCIAPQCERMYGWRLHERSYAPIAPDADGRLWSEELGMAIGPWRGVFVGEEHTWPRLYDAAGGLVLLTEERERGRADAERGRAERAEAQVAALAAKIAELEARA